MEEKQKGKESLTALRLEEEGEEEGGGVVHPATSASEKPKRNQHI